MKLTIEHLQNYLNSDLKVLDLYDNKVKTLIGLDSKAEENIILLSKNGLRHPRKIDEIKPYFHNLSDLTKEIEHNGEKIKIIDELFKCGCFCDVWNDWIDHFYDFEPKYKEINIAAAPYDLVQELLYYQIDIFGLIENNLAINKNEL